MKLDDIYVGVVSALIIIFLFVLYIAWNKDKQVIRHLYIHSHHEIIDNSIKDNISYDEHHKRVKENMKKIINKENKKSLFNMLLRSGYTGILRGAAIGIVTGGLSNGIAAALIYGLTNPIVMFIQETYLKKDKLPVN